MNERIGIDNHLADKIWLGITVFFGLQLRDPSAWAAFVAAELKRIKVAHLQSLPAGFAWSRRLYRSLRIDPTRHRPSSEALWRRLRDHDDFPRLEPLVEFSNLLSLVLQVPFGLYDLEKISGPIRLDIGAAGEGYPGIQRGIIDLGGKPVLRDAVGPFGNPSADSQRTSITAASRDAMLVLFFCRDDPDQASLLNEPLRVFDRFFGCRERRAYLQDQ